MSLRIVNLYFDKIIEKISEYGELDMGFYTSDLWPSKPNSTSRLNLINYAAINNLSDIFEIKNYVVNEFDDEIKSIFFESDFVVVHQNASKKTFSIVRKMLNFLSEVEHSSKIIFGTEGTWSSSKEFLTDQNISDIYKRYLLLRHTGKTDREFYIDESCLDLNVKEFELGIDTDLLSMGRMINDRKYISFVAAPDGRVTKNNDLICEIKDLIESFNFDLEIKILTPPYSSEEYWEVMSNSAFFIFTSNSETFSYCLNDAKALGAITFFPTHMFCTKVGARFVVDSYIDSSFRFSEPDEIIKKMKELIENPKEMAYESYKSRQYVIDNHSIQAVTKNWLSIFNAKNEIVRKLYIYDRSRDARSLDDIVDYCKEIGATHAMPYMNLESNAWSDDKFFFSNGNVNFIKYYLSVVSSNIVRGFVLNDKSQFRFGIGAKAGVEKESELLPFLSLVKRFNKITSFVVDDAVNSVELRSAVDLLNERT